MGKVQKRSQGQQLARAMARLSGSRPGSSKTVFLAYMLDNLNRAAPMGQITSDTIKMIEDCAAKGERASLTAWELSQLAQAWKHLKAANLESTSADTDLASDDALLDDVTVALTQAIYYTGDAVPITMSTKQWWAVYRLVCIGRDLLCSTHGNDRDAPVKSQPRRPS